MRSFNHNETIYSPEVWEVEYAVRRYLSGMSEAHLRDRYTAITKSMNVWTQPERDVIPIVSYQSSWFWFKKEHQTRLEFEFRGLDRPVSLYTGAKQDRVHQPNWRPPSGSNVLFRYGKLEYMREMVERGRMRVSPAKFYEATDNNEARRDEELRKHAYLPARYTKITTADGREIRPLGDIRRTVSGPDYHLICCSCIWNPMLFDEFEADCCVEVTNVAEFCWRVQAAGAAVFPGFYFECLPVLYFDPYDMGEREMFNSTFSKDFRFAYQNECRIVWAQIDVEPVDGFKFVEIGAARDIMRVYDRNQSIIQV